MMDPRQTEGWKDEIAPLLKNISSVFKKNSTELALQHYDMLMGSEYMHKLASQVVACKAEVAEARQAELLVNVLSPNFYRRKLTRNSSEVSEPIGSCVLDALRQVEHAWGVALLAAMQLMPEEQGHHEDMIDDYEQLFEQRSNYLRALKQPSRSVIDTVSVYHMLEGMFTSDVVSAALHKHATSTVEELVALVHLAKDHNVSINLFAGGLLEKAFVRCMKSNPSDVVLTKMIAAGLPPLTTCPFAMIFNSSELSTGKTVLDYYDLMLDYGIKPEPSTMRLLCKQCMGMAFACVHFTIRQKQMAECEREEREGKGGVPGNALAEQRDTQSAHPSGPNANVPSPSVPLPDSRRKDGRAYFERRLTDLAQRNPDAPLLEAMKVVHRAKVEGTSLQGDTLILSALLRLFCKGRTPVKDLVFPFEDSRACGPEPVEFSAPPEGSTPSLDGLDDDSDPDGMSKDSRDRVKEERSAYDRDAGEGGRGRASAPTTAPRRVAGYATAGDEARYVLSVLADAGSYPDNNLLKLLSSHSKGNYCDIDVMEQVTLALAQEGIRSKGLVRPVRCTYCVPLVRYYSCHRHRHRLAELVGWIVQQFYEYTALFNGNWFGETSDDNGEHFVDFLTAAMRTGSLPWVVGLFCVALAMSMQSISDVMQGRIQRFRGPEYFRSKHAKIIGYLTACEWDRDRILCCDELILDTCDNGDAGPSATSLDDQEAEDTSNAQGESSIYTLPVRARGWNTYSRSAFQHLSLIGCMHMALSDMHVGKEVFDFMKERVFAERQAALERRQSRA